MKSEPSISVVVPVYNGGAQLGQCLDALFASDFKAREIVVVDDGSRDSFRACSRSRGCSGRD